MTSCPKCGEDKVRPWHEACQHVDELPGFYCEACGCGWNRPAWFEAVEVRDWLAKHEAKLDRILHLLGGSAKCDVCEDTFLNRDLFRHCESGVSLWLCWECWKAENLPPVRSVTEALREGA